MADEPIELYAMKAGEYMVGEEFDLGEPIETIMPDDPRYAEMKRQIEASQEKL